jgi:hypothetical protein
VIRLGVRLTLAGGRAAMARLLLMTGGVAIGAALLCGAVTLPFGFVRESERGVRESPQTGDGSSPHLLWAVSRYDLPGGRDITSIAVASRGAGAPRPLGASRVPAPGTVLVSPELARRLERPASRRQLPPVAGRVVGRLSSEALHRPNELVFMTGWRYDALRAASPGVDFVVGFDEVSGWGALGVSLAAVGAVFVLIVITPVLLAPVLVFLGATARVGARRREQRLAAMRLVGATPGQVRTAAAVEAALAGVAGALIGLVLAAGLREVLARRGHLFASDFAAPVPAILLVVVLVPLLAAASAIVALRRVEVTPLGVTRRRPPRPVRATRWTVLAAGWALIIAGVPASEALATVLISTGIVLILVGLVRAGPWLLQRGARRAARLAHRPPVLLAARRIDADPRASFRPGAAVALSLFAATLVITVVSSTDLRRARGDAAARARPVVGPDVIVRGSSSFLGPIGTTPAIVGRLRAVPGVLDVAPVYADARSVGPLNVVVRQRVVVADCAVFASVLRTPASRCRAGALVPTFGAPATAASFPLPLTFRAVDGRRFPVTVPIMGRLDLLDDDRFAEVQGDASSSQISGLTALVPPSLVPPEALAQGEVTDVFLRTDRTAATARRLVGVLAAAAPGMDARPRVARPDLVLPSEYGRALRPQLFATLAFIFVVAACSLAVTSVDNVFERRRPLATLRAAGAGTATLRRSSLVELVVPLTTATGLGIGNGLAAGALFARALDAPISVPWSDVLAMPALVAGTWLAVAAVVVASVSRATATETLRTT